MKPPFILGITGRVGSGKSKAAACIQSHFEITIIDLDLIGHQHLENPKTQEELIKIWGTKILGVDQKIDRKKLSQIVFNPQNKTALSTLNTILHPKIKEEVKNKLKTLTTPMGLIVGALITEIGLREFCDHLIVIDTEEVLIKSSIGDKFLKVSPFQRNRKSYLEEADSVLHNYHTPSFCLDCIEHVKRL